MRYFSEEDVLHLVISDEPERGSVEIAPNIMVFCSGNWAFLPKPCSTARFLAKGRLSKGLGKGGATEHWWTKTHLAPSPICYKGFRFRSCLNII